MTKLGGLRGRGTRLAGPFGLGGPIGKNVGDIGGTNEASGRVRVGARKVMMGTPSAGFEPATRTAKAAELPVTHATEPPGPESIVNHRRRASVSFLRGVPSHCVC